MKTGYATLVLWILVIWAPRIVYCQESLKTIAVDQFGASHSSIVLRCNGIVGSRLLRCPDGTKDVHSREGLMITHAGPLPLVTPVDKAPMLTPLVRAGSHTYAYVVVAVDLLHGMSTASPPAYVRHSATLDGGNRVILRTYPARGPVPLYLWYASEDGAAYHFVMADQHLVTGSPDSGQRPADGRGWPADLPSLPINEDLWTTVLAVTGNEITVSDGLSATVANTEVFHDDTLAVQAAVDHAESVGGGIIKFGPYAYNLLRPAFWHGESWSRSIAGAESVYPPKVYIRGKGNIIFSGSGNTTHLINQPDAYTYGALVSFGTERPRPWSLSFEPIFPVQRGQNTVKLKAPADRLLFHAGDDVWLFSGSFAERPCLGSLGSPLSNCHYSEVNTIDQVDPSTGKLRLHYQTVNSYHDDGSSPFGIVNIAPLTLHNVGFKDLTIDTYGPISTESLLIGFSFDRVEVPVGPAANWWYGGLNRGWSVSNSTLNIGSGGMYFGVMNEMDQYADVTFINDTFIGHSAPRGADSLTADASIALDEGSGNVKFQHDRFLSVELRADNTYNGFSIVNCEFQNAGIHLGCGLEDGCGPKIASFGFSSDVKLEANNFVERPPFAPFKIIDIKTPTVNLEVIANRIETTGATLASIPQICLSSGNVEGNTMISDGGSQAHAVIQVVPSVIVGLPEPGTSISRNQILLRDGVAIEVEDPGTTFHGPISISGNQIITSNKIRVYFKGSARQMIPAYHSDIP